MEITLAVLGDGSVGKSSLINSFRHDGGFQPIYKQTIGVEFYEKKLDIRDKCISLRIWDIGGQSIHSKSIQHYINSSTVVFLVYDVTNMESFNNLDDWLRVLKTHRPTPDANSSSNVYLAANKVDMIAHRQVKASQHVSYATDTTNGFTGHLSCSAKSGENVLRTFYEVVGQVAGTPLTSGELQIYDKILKITTTASTSTSSGANGSGSDSGSGTVGGSSGDGHDDGGRTAFADQIEAEDRAAAAEAKRQAEQCMCCIA